MNKNKGIKFLTDYSYLVAQLSLLLNKKVTAVRVLNCLVLNMNKLGIAVITTNQLSKYMRNVYRKKHHNHISRRTVRRNIQYLNFHHIIRVFGFGHNKVIQIDPHLIQVAYASTSLSEYLRKQAKFPSVTKEMKQKHPDLYNNVMAIHNLSRPVNINKITSKNLMTKYNMKYRYASTRKYDKTRDNSHNYKNKRHQNNNLNNKEAK